MSKRFTDTNKFDDPWFCNLSKDAKLVWEFILAKCDNAGVWEPNFRIGTACLGEVDWDACLTELGDRIIVLTNGRWWAWKFVAFQYGQLSEACKPHQNVIRLLRQHGLLERLFELQSKGYPTEAKEYPKGIHTLQEKDKDKEEDKEEDKGLGSAEGKVAPQPPSEPEVEPVPKRDLTAEAQAIYDAYPRKVGKPEGLKAIRRQLSSHSLEFLFGCTRRYAIARAGQDQNFTPHPATWFNQQRFNDDPATWGLGAQRAATDFENF
jgi:hypothetical protein